MPKPVRVALSLALIAAVYCGWTPIYLASPGSSTAMMVVWTALVLGIGVINVVNACLDRGKGSSRRLAFWNMLLKLVLIPFYVIVFLLGFAISVGLAVVPGLMFAIPTVAGFLAVVDYVLLLFTSSYGFASIYRAYKKGSITGVSTALLIVAHLLFVADVIAAIVLYVMIRNAHNSASLIIEEHAA